MFYDLRPYQLLGIKKIVEERRILLADDMGLGKTAQAISAKHLIDQQNGSRATLVVCPTAVIPHWHEEIREWYYKGSKTKVATVGTRNYARECQKAQGADFVVTSYPVLSFLGANPERIGALNEIGFTYGILDEGHNTRNPDSLRSGASRELFHRIPYLTILSGTPIPNTLVDIYAQLNLLDPQNFPINDEDPDSILHEFYEIIRKKPHMIRDVLHSRMLRRTADKYLNKKMPKLEQLTVDNPLTGEHEAVYLELYQNEEIPPAQKLQELVKASLDPNLVNGRYLSEPLRQRLGSIASCTWGKLEEIVHDAVSKNGGKVIGFTDLKRKVIPELLRRFSSYGAIAITGDTNGEAPHGELSDREKARISFQRDSAIRALFATTVMDEGVDLTAGTHLIHITLPYMPATLDQRIRRSQRATAEVEKETVTSITLRTTLSNGLETIDEGIKLLLDDKRRIIRYIIESPEKLTLDDLNLIKNGHPEDSPSISGFLSEKRYMDWHLASLRGMGGARIQEQYEQRPFLAENLARAYIKHWEGFYAGNTATLSAQLIKQVLKDRMNPRVIDIASGPFSLSRVLGFPVTNLDLNKYMLEAGKILENEGKVPRGNIAYEGLAGELPFSDKEFDLVNCSLALHMTSLNRAEGTNYSDRETVLREANRVIPVGGFYTFALPHSVIHRQDMPTFKEGIKRLGFEVLPQTGLYKGSGESPFKVFFGALRKADEPQNEPLPEELLTWRMDARIGGKRIGVTKSLRKGLPKKKKKEQFEKIGTFVQIDSGMEIGGAS